MINTRMALAGAIALLAACSGGDKATPEEAPAPATDPYPFEPVNLDLWLERLEVNSRELYNARAEVAGALKIEPGERVADVGAGTGIYTLLFAEKAGPSGVVYAVDIAPRFLTLINQRADDLGLDNVVSVLGRTDSVTLPPESVDAVFIADTYHYFDDPAAIMKTVFEALRPGGALYIVDFDLVEGETAPPEKRHVRFGKKGVAAEIASFGFGEAEEINVPGLRENYMLRFVRP
jgi:ubiquinone/menaquinone biosynthesis C-methylase UbiE